MRGKHESVDAIRYWSGVVVDCSLRRSLACGMTLVLIPKEVGQ